MTEKGRRLIEYVCPHCEHKDTYALPDNAVTKCKCVRCEGIFKVDTRITVIPWHGIISAVVIYVFVVILFTAIQSC